MDSFDKSFLCLSVEVFLFLLSVFEECISYSSLKQLFFFFTCEFFKGVKCCSMSAAIKVKGNIITHFHVSRGCGSGTHLSQQRTKYFLAQDGYMNMLSAFLVLRTKAVSIF